MTQLKDGFDPVHDGVHMFRSILEAAANPGRSVNPGIDQDMWLLTAMTLLDGETTFYFQGDQKTAQYIQFMTGAKETGTEKADFLFLQDVSGIKSDEKKLILQTAKAGTHQDPHLSATVFAAAGKADIECRLKGPGVKPGSKALLPQEALEWMELRDSLEIEYPCGIDLYFITEGEMIAIPRLVRREDA